MAALLTACTTDAVEPDPAAVAELSLVSPIGAEGAALIEIAGVGVASPVGGTEVASEVVGDQTRVVLLRIDAGELRFRFAPAQGSRRGAATVLEVAGPDDQLRPSTQGYRLEVVP